MSHQPDADGFIFVKGKGRRRQSAKSPSNAKQSSGGFYSTTSKPTRKATLLPDLTIERQISEITAKKTRLLKSKFYASLDQVIDAITVFAPEEIVCYGIGSLFAGISQWQLALVLALNDTLRAPIHAFDPVATDDDDLTMLRRFSVSPIAKDEQAKRTATKRTLFYMPHCEQFLYENTMSANWSPDQLGRIMIIGNHFSRYQAAQTETQFAEASPHLERVLPHLSVIDMPSEALLGLRHCPYAFSDTCVQHVHSSEAAKIDFKVTQIN
ncbi:hypothetical protein IWW55_003834 [Coemansia sp. RSA 2706]|nr:hypothetical protein IWW55_003834 [Coemansia sp. RSA 2706]